MKNFANTRFAAVVVGVGLVGSACGRAGTPDPNAQLAPRASTPTANTESKGVNPSATSPGESPRAPARPPSPTPVRLPLDDQDIIWDENPVMEELGDIARQATDTKYLHTTIVDPSRGIFYFDCSGMAAWVLRRAAPDALAQVTHGLGSRRPSRRRPVASTFTHAILRSATDTTHGWQQVERVAEARPGDVIAWTKPPIIRSANTGHVGFVVLLPQELADQGVVAAWKPDGERHDIELGGQTRAYLVRIADATRLHHLDDSRQAGNRSGFGFGTILIVSDASGKPAAYGWIGPDGYVFATDIAIGRPLT